MSQSAPFGADYPDLPRLSGLALHPDGSRLVATMQQPDQARARYVSSLWEIPLDGSDEPARLTRSEQGESSPAFCPDGTLLFTSSRPGSGGAKDETAVWALPPNGEPQVLAHRAGGLGGPVVARDSGAVVLAGSRLVGSADHDGADHEGAERDGAGSDAERRAIRKDRRISAILHDGMPIRYWDHELGVESTRLLLMAPGAAELTDLAPSARFELEQAAYSISADGATVATSWRARTARGRRPDDVAVLDLASGVLRRIDGRGWELTGPQLSPDGRRLAVGRERPPTFELPPVLGLRVQSSTDDMQTEHTEHTEVELGDLTPTEWAWAPDSQTLFVAGDLHGRGAVLAVGADGQVQRRLVADAAYSSLCPGPDGVLYALRSAMDEAPSPVRLDIAATDQVPHRLPTPAPTPPLPGALVELPAAGGAAVHTWLFLPPPADAPAPVMLWIHGGPFASYNSWSWRWNPWVAVARGWAVVLPDPALSTGYGQACIDRAWPYRADVVWSELESALDEVLERPDVDGTRVALLGGSFGGLMTNWIAGHTQRFGAIVTHAGLWALDQQHATTDAAAFKTGIFGTPAEHPDWYARYSPHETVDRITTPMLIVHGNRDYRVPVSEALRLWWDLVSRWDGEPEQLPHRFLQFTEENHWILSPANAEIWYDAVLGFCAQHVRGEPWNPSPLL